MITTEHDKALDTAKINLIMRPDSIFLTTILFSLKFSWDDKIPTACTNGIRLKASPKFFLGLTKGQRIFLLAHEAYHVAFMHMARVNGRDFKLWNMACDYVINLMLVKAGFEFIAGGLLSEDYRDMSSYEVYDILKNKPEPELPECPDDMEEVEGDPNTINEIEQEITDTVSQAALRAKMANQAETIPGEIAVFLDKLLKPKLPWYRILANILNGLAQDDYSYRKPNRRYMPDFYLPSLYSELLGEIAVAVDVSGSVTQNEFNAFMSEINAIHNAMKPEKTTVISFDTEITNEYSIVDQKDILGLTFKGGGGTNIQPIYVWAKQHKPKALIIFTDGYFELHQYEIPKGIPIFWVIHSNANFTIKKGKVIHYVHDERGTRAP